MYLRPYDVLYIPYSGTRAKIACQHVIGTETTRESPATTSARSVVDACRRSHATPRAGLASKDDTQSLKKKKKTVYLPHE